MIQYTLSEETENKVNDVLNEKEDYIYTRKYTDYNNIQKKLTEVEHLIVDELRIVFEKIRIGDYIIFVDFEINNYEVVKKYMKYGHNFSLKGNQL